MTDPVFVNKPTDACPKCGHAYGFTHARPRFRSGAIDITGAGWMIPAAPDCLEWECDFCGYIIETPTADTPVHNDHDDDPRKTTKWGVGA